MRVADLQWGRVSWRQLRELGIPNARLTRWIREGYLRQVLPRVYAVGHVAESMEADLMAAILYAGPGAMLSHATALWWHGLLDHPPATIQVSTSRRCSALPGIEVHARRQLVVIHHRRLPTTTVAQALLDFAATAEVESVVRVLAEADYRRVLDQAERYAIRGSGRLGSATLKRALHRHAPELARTRSELERAFRALCRRGRIPAAASPRTRSTTGCAASPSMRSGRAWVSSSNSMACKATRRRHRSTEIAAATSSCAPPATSSCATAMTRS